MLRSTYNTDLFLLLINFLYFSDRPFPFSREQIRVVLFRECDFRGRKLLFDSKTVKKIQITSNTKVPNSSSVVNTSKKDEIYVEISNGYGYQYSKPSNDTVILGETVFGSVAMSYQGTSFKIHSFSKPSKLMCTLVFPCPKVRARSRMSTNNVSPVPPSSSSGVIVEKSGKYEYSSASSTTSNDALGQSTDSELKNLSCKLYFL